MSGYTRRSATYIGSLTLAAKVAERLAAFAQIAIVALIFGATTRADLYFVASIIPLTIGTIVGEALATSVLPSLVRREGGPELGPYLSATLWTALGVLVVVLVAYLGLVWFIVRRYAPTGTSSLLPWLAFSPTIVTLGLSSYLGSVLLLLERYTWPPFRAAAATAVGVILIGVSLLFTHSVTWIALSTSAGYLVAAGLLAADVYRALGLSWLRVPRLDDLRRLAALRGNVGFALAGGVVGGQTFVLVERALAAGLGVGTVSTISYARGVAFTSNIVGQSVAMGLYPGMLRAHEAGDPGFVRNALLGGVRLTLLISLAVVAFLAFFGGDVVHVLLQRGALEASDASGVARCLIAFSPAIVGSMLLIVSSRALYAIDYFRGILWSQLAVLAFYVPLAIALRRPYGTVGLAAAFGVAEIAGGVLGVALAARTVGTRRSDLRVLRALLRPLAIVVVAVAALRFVIDRLPLSNSALAFVGTFVAGGLTILVVSGCLLTSDWPEAAVLQRRLRGVRRRAGTGTPR